MSDADLPLRPCDLAHLLLASGDVAPRQRARAQEADRVGLDLRRRLLNEVISRDPEPEELEAALLDAVEAMGPPTGPTRSLALAFLEEWTTAQTTPEWIEHLLEEALHSQKREGKRRGGQLPG